MVPAAVSVILGFDQHRTNMLCVLLIIIVEGIPNYGMLLHTSSLVAEQLLELLIGQVHLVVGDGTLLIQQVLLRDACVFSGLRVVWLFFILHHDLYAIELFIIIQDYIIIYN